MVVRRGLLMLVAAGLERVGFVRIPSLGFWKQQGDGRAQEACGGQDPQHLIGADELREFAKRERGNHRTYLYKPGFNKTTGAVSTQHMQGGRRVVVYRRELTLPPAADIPLAKPRTRVGKISAG